MSPHVWRRPSKHTTPWMKPSHVGTHGDTCHSRKSHLRLDRVPRHATEIALSSPPPQQPPPAPARKIRASSLSCGGPPHLRPVTLPGVRRTWGAVGRQPWSSGWAVTPPCLQPRLFQLFRVVPGEAPRSGGPPAASLLPSGSGGCRRRHTESGSGFPIKPRAFLRLENAEAAKHEASGKGPGLAAGGKQEGRAREAARCSFRKCNPAPGSHGKGTRCSSELRGGQRVGTGQTQRLRLCVSTPGQVGG